MVKTIKYHLSPHFIIMEHIPIKNWIHCEDRWYHKLKINGKVYVDGNEIKLVYKDWNNTFLSDDEVKKVYLYNL